MSNPYARFPFPAEECKKRGISEMQWNVLINDTFPNAKAPESILAAFDTASVKGLDVFAGHLAIVEQSRKVGKNWVKVEDCWPTMKSLIYTAHQTKAFAGLDPVQFGPTVKMTFEGTRKDDQQRNQKVVLELSVPEFATVTVYRIVDGARCPFSDTVYFEEAAAMSFGLPTRMWAEKSRMMLGKVAKSAALRLAFAECDYSAEEMAGKPVQPSADVVSFSPEGQNTAPASQPEQQDEIPMSDDLGTNPDEPVSDFSQIDAKSLAWLRNTLELAVQQNAYGPAISNLQASLPPRYHALGTQLLRASETISASSAVAKIGPWLDTAISRMPAEYNSAVQHIGRQRESQVITPEVAVAMELTLSFHAVAAERANAA